MKKLFTVDDFIVAFFSALGYALGEIVSRLMGWPMLVCVGVSLLTGMALENITYKITFSKGVQSKPANRVVTCVMFLLVFLVVHYILVSKTGESLLDYVLEEFMYVIGLPILGFVAHLLLRRYREKKIRELYGDGSKGYVFDVDQEELEEANQQNRPIEGDYDPDCAVKTRTGVYVGEEEKDVMLYLGIPFAKPPVGARRWKAPEPLEPSEAVFEAKNFGASAVQVEHSGSIVKHHRQSEDCLYLNICVGDGESEEPKPVFVLFYNGDFSFGGSVDPLFYGDNYVREHPDTVFVSFNYRLGIFGFIDFSEVPGGAACPDALNLGLLDQIAALKWIRENIAAFGGDPERVTVIGFGAGATSICLLAASERAKGLFQRAFVFNGSPEQAYATPQVARALAAKLLKQTGASSVDELMKLKTQALKDAAQKLWLSTCAPTCGGDWLPADVYRAYQNGAASGVEFIVGIPGSERQVFRAFVGEQNYRDFLPMGVADMQACLDGPTREAVQAYLQARTAASGELDAQSKLLEQWNALCIYRVAAKLAEGGNRVRLLYWGEKPLLEKLGSGTVDAAAVLLGNREALQMYGNVMDGDLSEVLQSLLHKFIRGDELRLYPNEIKGVDEMEWEAFPRALIVSDGKLQCDGIEDRLTEVKGLLEFLVK